MAEELNKIKEKITPEKQMDLLALDCALKVNADLGREGKLKFATGSDMITFQICYRNKAAEEICKFQSPTERSLAFETASYILENQPLIFVKTVQEFLEKKEK